MSKQFCGLGIKQAVQTALDKYEICKMNSQRLRPEAVEKIYPMIEKRSSIGINILKLPIGNEPLKYIIIIINLFDGYSRLYTKESFARTSRYCITLLARDGGGAANYERCRR